MMSTIGITLRALALAMIVSIAGCTGERMGERFTDFGWPPGTNKEKPQPVVLNLAGRWMLTSPNRGQCGMNFTGAPKATEGTIAPEGGCPGRFYTSRKWTIEDINLIIRDHNGEQLAQLTPAGLGATWFEGQATTGERIMLAR